MNKHNFSQPYKGFTLIEILVVIGILAVLLTIALVAINPARQFAQSNNTKRRSDALAILNAIHQYGADNKGVLPTYISTTEQNIASTEADICADLVTTYLAALPQDPQSNGGANIDCSVAYDTGYTVVRSGTDNRVTVRAPGAELNETIEVTR
jgi:type IV pilus assembly protein PilA